MQSKILTLDTMPCLSHFVSRFTELGPRSIKLKPEKFPDGEFFVKIPENVRGHSVYLVTAMHSTNVFDILITIDTLKRACAAKITLVVPYLPYSRQDRRADVRTPISAKVLADMIEKAGCDHVITMDVHALQIEGFYNIQFDNLQGSRLLIDNIFKDCPGLSKENTMFVAPDAGAAKRTRHLAELYGVDVAILDKKRLSSTEVKSYLIGEVNKKHCIMLDDMFSSGGTMKTGAAVLREAGAQSIIGACIHMLGDPSTMERHLYKMYYLNTVGGMQPPRAPSTYYQQVDCVKLFLDSVYADTQGESVSSMFNQ